MKKKPRIILEPRLELQAACLNAHQCRVLAQIYLRWARQLFVKARILEFDSKPKPKPRLVLLPVRRSRLN